jgi:Subtilase family
MNRRSLASLTTTAIVLAGMATAMPAHAAPASRPAAPSKVPSLVRSQVAAMKAALGARPGARLNAQQQQQLSHGMLGVRADGGIDLQVHAVGVVGAAQSDQLRALGASVLSSSAEFSAVAGVALPTAGLIHAVVPYDKVDQVAALDWVATLRPTFKGVVDAGPITSEGTTLHNTAKANRFGLTGKGQTIGFISDGVTSLAQAQARGELPPTVKVLDAGSGDEGTAMMEIVHDEAPGANLMFNSVGQDVTSYVAAFRNLAANGATMIAEDIAFDDEPAFQQGLGAATADSLAKHGIWVSSSAGNLGAKHAPRVSAVGTGRTPDDAAGSYASCPVAPRNTVNLRGTDNTYDVIIRPGGAILPTLQWSEPRAIYPTAGQGGFTDLNLYLMNSDGTDCLASSTNVQANGVGDTIEQLLYENNTAAAVAGKLVVDVAGTSSAVKAPRLDLRWRTAAVTTVDPADRAGSLNPDSNYLGWATSAGAVGADLSTDPKTIPLEAYSAAGPVQIGVTTRCPHNAAGPCQGVAGSGFSSYQAPQWAAADGVSVSGVGGFGSGTCPAVTQGDCRFYGTSAAAPSAAGVAAVMRQGLGGQLAPRLLTVAMQLLAVHRTGEGFGAGVLRAVP